MATPTDWEITNISKRLQSFDKEEIFIKDNFKVVRIYRQSLDENLPWWDLAAMGTPPSDVWNDYGKMDNYKGNWRDYQLNCYGHCFYFVNEEKTILQWDLFYPRGAHIHYNGMMPSRGIVGKPLDWAYKILDDVKLFKEHFLKSFKRSEFEKLDLVSEDLKPLRDCIDGLYKGIIVN